MMSCVFSVVRRVLTVSCALSCVIGAGRSAVRADDELLARQQNQILVAAAPLELTFIGTAGDPVFGFDLGTIDEERGGYRPGLVMSVCELLDTCLESMAGASESSEVVTALQGRTAALLAATPRGLVQAWCPAATLQRAGECANIVLGAAIRTDDTEMATVCICPGGSSSKCSPSHSCNPGKKCGPMDAANPTRGYCRVGA